jgi:hypothetical protein
VREARVARVDDQIKLVTSAMSGVERGEIPIMQEYTRDIRQMHKQIFK